MLSMPSMLRSKTVTFGCAAMRTLLFLSIFLLPFFSSYAQDDLKRISELREWSVLLHYNSGWLSDRSLVDDETFFLSPEGKHDRYAELKELYRQLYEAKEGENVACRFPARALFLAGQLGRPADELRLEECAELNEFLQQVGTDKVSIIFPFYQMNGPASMFGHTLLRFDSAEDTSLVSSAVTYAADYNKKDNGIEYAVKGLTGLYAGRTQILAYHEKIKEYDNKNQRDIWEYQLNLTSQETKKAVLHVYEIKGVWSRYYFFDENCSYNLLFIIEAARPDVHLTDQFLWVIPIDTILLLKENGLLGDMTFRPSQSARMLNILKDKESPVYAAAVESLKKGELVDYSGLADSDKAKLLDFWTEYTIFINRNLADRKLYSSKLISVLKKRATIKEKYDNIVPTPVEPLQGHKTARLKLGVGSTDDGVFQEINWHPAIHMPEDSDEGYLQGSTLAFFDFTARHYRDKTVLSSLSLVDIYSLSPVNELFNPVSWRVHFGLEYSDEKDSMSAFFRPSSGKAYRVLGGLVYGLAGLKLQYNPEFEDEHSAAFEVEAGYMVQKGKTKLLLKADHYDTLSGELNRDGELSSQIIRYITKDSALSATYTKQIRGEDSFRLAYHIYY